MKWILIVISLLMFIDIVKELYVLSRRGKVILEIKHKKRTKSDITFIVFVIIVFIVLILNIIFYFKGKPIDVFNFFLGISLIENCMQRSILRKQSLGIRENGICLEYIEDFTSFYKWNQILNYEWISPNEIQFKIQTNGVRKKIINPCLKVENTEKEYVCVLLRQHINLSPQGLSQINKK